MSVETEVTLPSSLLNNNELSSEIIEEAFPLVSQRTLAWKDLLEGVQKWPIWFMLAYQDIKLRYRRSVLGPFWITLSMAITVYSMGFLYARLFHMEPANYFPFLVAGMLSWSLIAACVTELTDGLVSSDGYIKQIKLPYSLYIHRIACRNVLIFFHNLLVIVPILLIYHETAQINLYTLLMIPGLLILYINAISYGLIVSMIGARYRDVSQIIKSLVQVIFFVTPVMWSPTVLSPHNQFIVNLNPFYAFVQCVREPMLGRAPSLFSFGVLIVTTILGILICSKMFARYRARIVYWL